MRAVYKPSRGFLLALALLLALLHAVLAVTATVDKSMTADEIAHLTAGQAYNVRNDYRLHPENGNLPQRLAALPMTVARVPLPPSDSESWRTADIWNYGHRFFYRQGVSTGEWLFLGRSMIAMVSAATGLLVFFWSRALFGWRGGFLSLVLFTFSPTFLAHGALTTSDVVMTFFFLASVGAWWRHLQNPGAVWTGISAATLGLAFVAKFSAVLLPPMLTLIAIPWLVAEQRRTGWRTPLSRLARTIAVHAIATWAIIWLFYGFRFSAFAPEFSDGATFNHGWGWTLTGIGFPAKVIWWIKEARLLPEAWLYGLAFVLQFSRARGAFMSGEYSIYGWVWFFPWTFLIKTTLPFLLISVGGAVAALVAAARSRLAQGASPLLQRLWPLTPLAVLFAGYWITSLASHLNIGHRHILPTYPVLFIAAGWSGRYFARRKCAMATVIAGLLAWQVAASQGIRPHYLAYFNPLVGGPANGWRHLVDSSLDWGQDLSGLKDWIDRHARRDRVYLSYFGTGDPEYEGLQAAALPCLPVVGEPRPWVPLQPGLYAISATMLQQVYSPYRGDWTLNREQEFQRLRALEPMLLALGASGKPHESVPGEGPADEVWKRYDQLRFARLCHYLRVRPCDAMIGYSILVYRLDSEELAAATGESLKAWSALIERTVTGG